MNADETRTQVAPYVERMEADWFPSGGAYRCTVCGILHGDDRRAAELCHPSGELSDDCACVDCGAKVRRGQYDGDEWLCNSCSLERQPGICICPTVVCVECGYETPYRERGTRWRICPCCLEQFVTDEDEGRGYGHAPVSDAKIEAYASALAEADDIDDGW